MRRIPVALGASLLVHALLLLLLWRAAPLPPSAGAPEREPLLFQVVQRPAPPPPAVATPAPARPSRRKSAKRDAPTAAKPQQAAQAPAPQPPRPSDVPTAPRPLDLRPRLSWTPPVGSIPAPRGRTLRPGDPSLSAEVQRAEEHARVQGRLEGFGDEAFSAARARGGLPHPYLVEVGEALQRGLKDAGPRTAEGLGFGKGMQPVLQQYVQNYRASAEQFARSGNPGLNGPSRGTQSERLEELMPDENWLRGLVQAGETRNAILSRGPLLALSLELTQGRDGGLLSAAIVQSSGNRLFDSLVMQVAPAALGAAGAPPAEAFRREHLRSIWRVEGRLELSAQTRTTLASLLPDISGIPTGMLLQQLKGETPRLSYDARLLRYY